jgi:hypothetical protein
MSKAISKASSRRNSDSQLGSRPQRRRGRLANPFTPSKQTPVFYGYRTLLVLSAAEGRCLKGAVLTFRFQCSAGAFSPASCCSFEIRARQSRSFPDPFTSFATLIRRGTACCARHQFLATTLRISRSRSRPPFDFAFRGFRLQRSAGAFSPACPERSQRASCSAVWPL